MNWADILIVTYCSRDKDQAAGMMPAVGRYLSPRIRAAHEAAQMLGADFCILSGLHGLLRADEDIANYDYLLIPEQVPDHARKVAAQLRAHSAETVVFFTRAKDVDPGAGPYSAAMRQACTRARVGFQEVVFSQAHPSRDDLVALVRSQVS